MTWPDECGSSASRAGRVIELTRAWNDASTATSGTASRAICSGSGIEPPKSVGNCKVMSCMVRKRLSIHPAGSVGGFLIIQPQNPSAIAIAPATP